MTIFTIIAVVLAIGLIVNRFDHFDISGIFKKFPVDVKRSVQEERKMFYQSKKK